MNIMRIVISSHTNADLSTIHLIELLYIGYFIVNKDGGDSIAYYDTSVGIDFRPFVLLLLQWYSHIVCQHVHMPECKRNKQNFVAW